MEFKKYSEAENTYRQKYVNDITDRGLSGGIWVIEEKLHGANFTIYFDGTNFECAKRTAPIEEAEDFFKYEKVLEDNKESVKKLFELVSNNYGVDYLSIYGELFGGAYPHPDVERNANAKKVQSGIWYTPDNKFYAFDLKVNGDFVMTVEEAKALFKEAGLFHAKTLFTGSFKEALEFNQIFLTTIPAMFGLPEIDDNFAEGVVIKPDVHKRKGDGRVMLKNKHPDHIEKNRPPKKPREPVKLSEEGDKLYLELLSLINENRLKSVLSKFGEVTQKDFGKVMGLVVKDAIEEFMKDFNEEFNKLEKSERKHMTKALSKETGNMIRPNFLNIIDGMY